MLTDLFVLSSVFQLVASFRFIPPYTKFTSTPSLTFQSATRLHAINITEITRQKLLRDAAKLREDASRLELLTKEVSTVEEPKVKEVSSSDSGIDVFSSVDSEFISDYGIRSAASQSKQQNNVTNAAADAEFSNDVTSTKPAIIRSRISIANDINQPISTTLTLDSPSQTNSTIYYANVDDASILTLPLRAKINEKLWYDAAEVLRDYLRLNMSSHWTGPASLAIALEMDRIYYSFLLPENCFQLDGAFHPFEPSAPDTAAAIRALQFVTLLTNDSNKNELLVNVRGYEHEQALRLYTPTLIDKEIARVAFTGNFKDFNAILNVSWFEALCVEKGLELFGFIAEKTTNVMQAKIAKLILISEILEALQYCSDEFAKNSESVNWTAIKSNIYANKKVKGSALHQTAIQALLQLDFNKWILPPCAPLGNFPGSDAIRTAAVGLDKNRMKKVPGVPFIELPQVAQECFVAEVNAQRKIVREAARDFVLSARSEKCGSTVQLLRRTENQSNDEKQELLRRYDMEGSFISKFELIDDQIIRMFGEDFFSQFMKNDTSSGYSLTESMIEKIVNNDISTQNPAESEAENVVNTYFTFESRTSGSAVTREGAGLFQASILKNLMDVTTIKEVSGAYIFDGRIFNKDSKSFASKLESGLANSTLSDDVNYIVLNNYGYSKPNDTIVDLVYSAMGESIAVVLFPKSWETTVNPTPEQQNYQSKVNFVAILSSAIVAADCYHIFDDGSSFFSTSQFPDGFIGLVLLPMFLQLIPLIVETVVAKTKGFDAIHVQIPAWLSLPTFGYRTFYTSRPKSRNDMFDTAAAGWFTSFVLALSTTFIGLQLTADASVTELASFPTIPLQLLRSSPVTQQLFASQFPDAVAATVPTESLIHCHWVAIAGLFSVITSTLQLIPSPFTAGTKLLYALQGPNFTVTNSLAQVTKGLFYTIYVLTHWSSNIFAVVDKESLVFSFLLWEWQGFFPQTQGDQISVDGVTGLTESRKIAFAGFLCLFGFAFFSDGLVSLVKEIVSAYEGVDWASLSQGVGMGGGPSSLF